MSDAELSPQSLNKAMLEAVDFIHAEGWDRGPTLFALVPTELLVDALDGPYGTDAGSPLTLVVQDNLPSNLEAGSEALGDYISRLEWPAEVVGAILAQEIVFNDSAEPDAPARPARLFSGVLRGDAELTLLQLRPTEEEMARRGPFAEDEIELRGGPGVAPGVIAALRYTLEAEPEDL
ncbi:PPA1309 family protein [Corynebacterium pacaense]|uniref:PPA1309 family protein n=1 Tax=Corynebacterium pacaense TaxID=1816684 RepID=UPI0009BA6A9C|nr:PPA1309 family protein [Corynebacterium pacaense]